MKNCFMLTFFKSLWQMNWLCLRKHGTKIKAIPMQTSKIIQAVILMMIIALAASCAAGKQYSQKVFGPRISTAKEKTEKPVRFLDTDDTTDRLSPLVLTKQHTTTDSTLIVRNANEIPKVRMDTVAPVVRSGNTGGVRTKRTRDDQ
jgi:hypothetical protein